MDLENDQSSRNSRRYCYCCKKKRTYHYTTLYFVAFLEYPNFMKKYGMCNEFDHSAGLVDFFYHFTQYSTYRFNWGGGPEMAIFPYITVVCIKVGTASFPRFWKNHP